MEQFKYTIINPNEDPRLAVIRKENVSVEFTLGEIEADKRAAMKIKEQIESQINLDEAQIKNIEINHPYVLEVSEDEKKRAVAITLHNGLSNKVKESKLQLDEVNKVFEENDVEMADIKAQTGLDLNAPVESPVISEDKPE